MSQTEADSSSGMSGSEAGDEVLAKGRVHSGKGNGGVSGGTPRSRPRVGCASPVVSFATVRGKRASARQDDPNAAKNVADAERISGSAFRESTAEWLLQNAGGAGRVRADRDDQDGGIDNDTGGEEQQQRRGRLSKGDLLRKGTARNSSHGESGGNTRPRATAMSSPRTYTSRRGRYSSPGMASRSPPPSPSSRALTENDARTREDKDGGSVDSILPRRPAGKGDDSSSLHKMTLSVGVGDEAARKAGASTGLKSTPAELEGDQAGIAKEQAGKKSSALSSIGAAISGGGFSADGARVSGMAEALFTEPVAVVATPVGRAKRGGRRRGGGDDCGGDQVGVDQVSICSSLNF